MPTARPFAYNTGSTIPGTIQVGNLAVGTPTSPIGNPPFWNGPDEDLGYVIAVPVSGNTQPTPMSGITASVGFYRTNLFDDTLFIKLSQYVAETFGNPQTFASADEASAWLTESGYWNSYSTLTTPVLSLDAANYLGSGDWIDSIGGKKFELFNSPTWSPSEGGGSFKFNPLGSQYAVCNTSLPDLSTWTVAVWHFYDGTETGSLPCIVTETFIGGTLNYSLGNNNGPFSTGFYDGNWEVTDGYNLTPNNWYYIVGTYDGSNIILYVNDTLVDITSYTGTPISSGAGIRLMERWDSAEYWGGKLSTVDIFDTALTHTEITSRWNLTKSRFGL